MIWVIEDWVTGEAWQNRAFGARRMASKVRRLLLRDHPSLRQVTRVTCRRLLP